MMGTNGWGFEMNPTTNAITTTPSLDSTIGTGLTVIPASGCWVGHDQFVRDNAGAGPPRTYEGVPVAAGQAFSIEEFTRGLVDIYEVWLYAPGGVQEVQVIFKGV